jgi:hypothetical protein
VLTSIPGGFTGSGAFSAAASVLLINILAIFVASSFIAVLGFLWQPAASGHGYIARLRAWSTALLITWGVSLIIYCIALFTTDVLEYWNIVDLRGIDPVSYLIRYTWLLFDRIELLSLYVVYFVYSAAAVVSISLLFRPFMSTRPLRTASVDDNDGTALKETAVAPKALHVALINALLMTSMFAFFTAV